MKFHRAVHDTLTDQAQSWQATNPVVASSFADAAKVLKDHEQKNGDDDGDEDEDDEEEADNL